MSHKIYNILTSLIITIITILRFTTISAADTGDRYLLNDNGNWIAVGGHNTFDCIKATTREETEQLESTLLLNDYILVNTDIKHISDEDFEALLNGKSFWFSSYLENKPATWNKYRVYMYKPSLSDYLEQLENRSVMPYTQMEIAESSVVIDYSYWDSVEKVGTITDEYDDNIPSYITVTGYMEIRSPINCTVKVMRSSTRTYHVFTVTKDKPLLVRLVGDCYHIVQVNKQSIPDNIDNSGEDTLPYNNQIQILETCTKENPYVIELHRLTNKYSIPSLLIDNEGKIVDETSIEKSMIEVDEEQTVITEENSKQSNEDKNIIIWVVLGIVSIIGIIYLTTSIIKFKRSCQEPDNENDEEYIKDE